MNTVKIESKNVKMVAHRGVSGLERENTCPAFVAAGNRTYFGVETDVHVTKDGRFVIIHDETTDRVSLGAESINVEENDYAAVEKITLPDLDGSTLRQDIRIPLLLEYVSICKKYEKICVLEIKNHFMEEDLKRLIEEIQGVAYLDQMIFISFDFENCVNLRRMLPKAKIQWLVGGKTTMTHEQIEEALTDHHLDFDVYYKLLTKEWVDQLHKKGIEVNCWTCDQKDAAEELVAMGVDYITTNILE